MTSAILHPLLETINWKQIREMDLEPAAIRLTSILSGMDRLEKQIYAVRGMAMLIVEERQLYRWIVDDEVGDYFQSFDRWLKQTCPDSWRYCREALAAVKELKDMPFVDLLQIKRCNLEQLKRVSSGVRILPEVVKAAKTLPEKEFVQKLNQDHQQHLEVKQPVVLAPVEDVSELETAIALAITCEGCTSRSEALKCIAVNYIVGHQDQVEQNA